MYRLKHKNFNLLSHVPIPLAEFGSSEQLQKWEMSFLHVEDPSLLLVNMRTVNDNAPQLIQFQGACCRQYQ